MKLPILLSLLFSGLALAQAPAPSIITDLKITAKTVASKRSENKTWETDYGSYQKTIEQTKSVQVQVRNRTDKPGIAVIEIIWLVKNAERRGGPAEIGGISRVEVPLKAREETVIELSQSASRQDDKYAALGLRFQEGEAFAGWVARAINTQTLKVVDIAASGEPLKAFSDKVPVVKDLPATDTAGSE